MLNRSLTFAALACVAAASACSGGGGGGSCESLIAGDLVITEVMANPEGEDKGFEWFEIFNATSAGIDLEGVELTSSRADGTDRRFHAMSSVSIEPGQYLVVGNATGGALPEWVGYAYGTSLGDLRNSGGRLSVECDLAAIDEVVYGDAESGKSLGFDGNMAPDALANDDVNAWCEGKSAFGDGQSGTPGAANDACEGGVTPGTCKDGFGERLPVPPKPGDLVISEIMPDPFAPDENGDSQVSDTNGEWFEVHVKNPVDLNGLEIGMDVSKDPKLTLKSDTCLKFVAGSFVLFARKADATVNGGLPQVDFETSVGLSNSTKDPETGLYLKMNGLILDQVDYVFDKTANKGASISLDPDFMDVTANDDPANWCPGATAYGLGDKGTPGAANEECP